MAKGVLLVMTNVKDPAQDADFNDWYNNVHLTDVLLTPGIVKATRFELATGRVKEGRGKYLALYEIDTEDPAGLMAKLNETMERRAGEGSVTMHPALDVANFGIYTQIGEPRIER